MGSFCSCCSRETKTVSRNTSEDERQAMLEASISTVESATTKIKQLKTINTKLTPLAKYKYGSTSETSYTPLKDKSGSNKILNTTHASVDESKISNIIEVKEIKEEEEEEHNISIKQTNLVITGGGYNEINGDYRWFVHSNKWCLFKENISYSLDKGIDVEQVYSQLKKLQSAEANFRWDKNINNCWIISDMDGKTIYYAAPQSNKYNNYIPNDKNIWISVHGSLPSPDIYANLLEQSNPPDKDETFGNITNINTLNLKQKSFSNSLPAINESNQNNNDNDNIYSDIKEIENDDVDDDDDDASDVSDLD
eukprot:425709_1